MRFRVSGTAFPRLRLRYFSAAVLILTAGLSVVTAQRKPAPAQQPKSSSPASAGAATPEWPQWGGPHRNFEVVSGALKESWPAGGPKQLWSRPLGEGHSAILVDNGKLYTTHCLNSKSKTYHGDQWVTCEVEVRGSGKVVHRVFGESVLEYEQPQLDPKDPEGKALIKGDKLLLEEGYISLQSESHPCEFRKVEIKVFGTGSVGSIQTTTSLPFGQYVVLAQIAAPGEPGTTGDGTPRLYIVRAEPAAG